MIHSVDPTSTAQTLGLAEYDALQSVDGRRYESLDALITYLQERPRGPITIVVRRGSDDTYRYFEYHRRELPGEDIQIVKPESSSEVAGKP